MQPKPADVVGRFDICARMRKIGLNERAFPMDFADWNRGLLLGGLLVVIAVIALVSGRTVRDRVLAAGILSQGILMTFVAGSAYYPRAELEIGAIAVLAVFCLWCVWAIRAGAGESKDGP